MNCLDISTCYLLQKIVDLVYLALSSYKSGSLFLNLIRFGAFMRFSTNENKTHVCGIRNLSLHSRYVVLLNYGS
jgi:hypothetical protein